MTSQEPPRIAAAPPLTIRPFAPGDEAAVLACHNAVFAPPGAGRAERTLAHWRWKFAANPTGRVLQMLAVAGSGDVVGVYAALPVAVTCDGRRALAAQALDHCVRPEWLRHGGENGLFAELGQAFLARWLGTNGDQVLFLYGLPVASWRGGARHLGWQIARDWDATFRDVTAATPPRSVPGAVVVRRVECFDADTTALFTRLEPDLGVATVRDAGYLNWRYAAHPERRYTLFECRERAGGALRGWCVYTTGDVGRPHTSYLVDWLFPADDAEAMVALLAACEDAARTDGTGLLCSVCNPMDPRFLAIQELGYRVRGTPWFLALRTARYDTVFFREHWHFTLGDSDLV